MNAILWYLVMLDAISFFKRLQDCPLCKRQLGGIFVCTESKIENLFSNSFEERFFIERYVQKSEYIFYSDRNEDKTIDLRSFNPINISACQLYCPHKDENNILEHYSLLPERESFYLKKEEIVFTISCSRDNIVISTYSANGNYDREFTGDFYLKFKNRFEIENFIQKASLL